MTHGGIPVELSSFVGRASHVTRGVGLLGGARLVTLVGPGGSGKTRLAGRIATEAAPRFAGGVHWVELAAVARGRDVAGVLGGVLGIPVPDVDAAQRIAGVVAALGAEPVLVALDNCEHVLAETALLVDGLLRAGPRVVVLATSREPLGVEGETVWRIPPLEVPPVGARAGAVWSSEAVQLFLDRAERLGPGVPRTAEVAAIVAAVCRTLDGMPLAIELAAARTASMPVGAILAGLDDRFRLLDDGPRAAPDRLRSMTASLSWSHELCTQAEQVCWRRLAVFAGGFDADAATWVAGFAPLDPEAVGGLLASLVNRSLVQLDPRPGGSARYAMLETVRAFARDQLRDRGETRTVADRHLAWAVALAERLEPATALCDVEALDRLDREAANIRAAVSHATSAPPPDHDGLRLVSALAHFWARRGHGVGGGALGEEAVAAAEAAAAAPAVLVGRACWALALARFYGGDMPAAATLALRAARDAEQPDVVTADPSLLGRCRLVLGAVRLFTEPAETRVLVGDALCHAQETGDDWLRFESLGLLALSHLFQHRPEDAAPFRARYAELAASRPDLFGSAWVHLHTAITAQIGGDLTTAAVGFRAALDLGEVAREPLLQWYSCAGLAELAVVTDDAETLAGVAVTMNRPHMRFAPPVVAFADALSMMAARPDAVDAALTAAGTAITPYTPCSGPRLVLAGARRALARGDLDAAERAATDALTTCEAVGSALAGACRVVLARVALDRGDPDAVRLCHDGLAQLVDAGVWADVPEALALLGGVAVDAGRPEEGMRLLAASWSPSGAVDPFGERAERDRSRAVAVLGGDADRVWDEGAALDLAAAAAYARRARGRRGRPRSGWASLTPAETAVVRLVAAGHTNPQIAARLFVSAGTVKTHLGHVFAKLGVSSRAELAALATRHAS